MRISHTFKYSITFLFFFGRCLKIICIGIMQKLEVYLLELVLSHLAQSSKRSFFEQLHFTMSSPFKWLNQYRKKNTQFLYNNHLCKDYCKNDNCG